MSTMHTWHLRTTVNISDPVLARAKRAAETEGLTLGEFVERALRERLMRRQPEAGAAPFRLVTFGQGGLRAGLTFDRLKDIVADEEIEKVNRAPAVRSAVEDVEDEDDAARRR